MFGRGSVTIARLWGVPIRLHISFFLAIPLIAYIMAAQFQLTTRVAGVSSEAMVLSPLAWGFLLAILLFFCVLIHELAHVAVARRQGANVRSVTLMLLGGVSEIEQLPGGPSGEARMALVGPGASLLIALVCYGLYRLFPGAGPDVQFGLFYLAYLNLILGIFNLIPAFPLDGGRALRALLVNRLGRVRATQTAARIGQGLAVLFGLIGFFGGNLILLLIAFFLYSGAAAESRMETARAALRGLRVGDFSSCSVVKLPADLPLGEAARLLFSFRKPVGVVMEGEKPIGILDAGAIRRVPRQEWPNLRVRDAARLNLPAISPSAELINAVDMMQRLDTFALVVWEEGREDLCVITQTDIARGLELSDLRLQTT